MGTIQMAYHIFQSVTTLTPVIDFIILQYKTTYIEKYKANS